MLAVETEVFLQLPSEADKRILHPGEITGAEEDIWVGKFAEPHLKVAGGDDMLLYYEIERKFSKQPVSILAVDRSDMQPSVSFKTAGEPVQAEDRECYRISTVSAEMTTTLGTESDCPLTDISANGFSALAERSYVIGQKLSIMLPFEGQTYTGTAVVQSIKPLTKPWTRYGLSWVGDKIDGGDLEDGAHKMSMAMQREQLRRRSGAAA